MKRARNIGTDSDKIVEKIRSKIDKRIKREISSL